jgi:hypothetical protein
MAERTYWYLGKSPINVPYWTDVTHCETETEGQAVLAPMLFTTRDKAEAELRWFNEEEPDEYLRAIKVWGEDSWNRALDNTPSLQVFEIGEWLLREHLSDSEITYVMIDHALKPARRLAEELG